LNTVRSKHPAVTFNVKVCKGDEVEPALSNFSADIALIFEPKHFDGFHGIIAAAQQVRVMFPTGHPLSKFDIARLSECTQYPLALPTRASGLRHLLEQAAIRSSLKLPLVIESDSQA
jgi:DNA-binding transcriptional LysR family regulator